MKNVFGLIFIFMVMTSILSAKEGIINTDSVFNYKIENSIEINDWTPAISDLFYVAISYDGTTWNPISEVIAWGNERPTTKAIKFIPDSVIDVAYIGVFVNPNDTWSNTPVEVKKIKINQKIYPICF